MRMLALAIGTGVLLATAALATPPVTPKRPLSSDDLAVQAMHNFAACVADRYPHAARKLLADRDVPGNDYRRALGQLSDGAAEQACLLGGNLRFSGDLLTGGIAEALLKSDHRLSNLATWVAYSPSDPVIEAHGSRMLIGLCIVRTAPDRVAAVFATEPTSREESVALAALTPTLTNCVPQGVQLQINKPGLRSLMALSAYRFVRNKTGIVASAAEKH